MKNLQAPDSKLQKNFKLQASKRFRGMRRFLGLGFWNFLAVSDHSELEKNLGYSFLYASLLRLALTHPSVAHEKGAPVLTNQRLEFLGDAVLQLVLTQVLYERF